MSSLDNIAKEVDVSTGFENNDFSETSVPDFGNNIIIENDKSAQPVVTIENNEPNPMKEIHLDKNNPIKDKKEIPKAFTPENKNDDDNFFSFTMKKEKKDPFSLKKDLPELDIQKKNVAAPLPPLSRNSSVSSGGSSILEYKAPVKKKPFENNFFSNFSDIANKSKHKPSDPTTSSTKATTTQVPEPTAHSGYNSDTSSVFNIEQSKPSTFSSSTPPKKFDPETYAETNRILSEDEQKQDLLIKLQALETRGVRLTREFSMKSRLDDIRFEYEKQKYLLEKDQGIDFMKNVLITIVHGIEILNKKFDPIGAKLGGWSESVMENITSYESIFEKLYNKYCDTVDVAPELELLLTLASSAFMYHMMQTVFKTSLPNLSQTMLNNPVLMREMGRSVAQAADTTQNQQSGIPQPSNQNPPSGGGGFDFGSILSGLFPPQQQSPPRPPQQQQPQTPPTSGHPSNMTQAFQNPLPRPISTQMDKVNHPSSSQQPTIGKMSKASGVKNGPSFSVTKRSKSNKKTITF